MSAIAYVATDEQVIILSDGLINTREQKKWDWPKVAKVSESFGVLWIGQGIAVLPRLVERCRIAGDGSPAEVIQTAADMVHTAMRRGEFTLRGDEAFQIIAIGYNSDSAGPVAYRFQSHGGGALKPVEIDEVPTCYAIGCDVPPTETPFQRRFLQERFENSRSITDAAFLAFEDMLEQFQAAGKIAGGTRFSEVLYPHR